MEEKIETRIQEYCTEKEPVFDDFIMSSNGFTTKQFGIEQAAYTYKKTMKCMREEYRIVKTLANGEKIFGEWIPVAGSEWKEEES